MKIFKKSKLANFILIIAWLSLFSTLMKDDKSMQDDHKQIADLGLRSTTLENSSFLSSYSPSLSVDTPTLDQSCQTKTTSDHQKIAKETSVRKKATKNKEDDLPKKFQLSKDDVAETLVLHKVSDINEDPYLQSAFDANQFKFEDTLTYAFQ